MTTDNEIWPPVPTVGTRSDIQTRNRYLAGKTIAEAAMDARRKAADRKVRHMAECIIRPPREQRQRDYLPINPYRRTV